MEETSAPNQPVEEVPQVSGIIEHNHFLLQEAQQINSSAEPEQQNQPEEPEVAMFKTSQFPQQPELKAFLQEKLANPYNKYCIDCKKNQTTHAIVWLGVFVCKDCANLHKETFGGNQYSYIKDVYNEHWDDYQLRSISFGGNQPLFQIMKEYGVDNHPLQSKYRHACVNWYRKRHIALMDGLIFDTEANPKPPQNWDERMQQTKATLGKTAESTGATLKVVGSEIKEKGLIVGAVVSEKASAAGAWTSEKASSLKAKVQSKDFGKKMMSMFGKKKKEGELDDGEERKEGDEEAKEPQNTANE